MSRLIGIIRPFASRFLIVLLAVLLIVQVGLTLQAKSKASVIPAELSWPFQPQSLKELYDLSDVIVLVRVNDVLAGPQLIAETTSPDHPTLTIDTMLINVSVVKSVKGEQSVESETTIYRQVNVDENTHQVGELYLLFLRKRVESTSNSDGPYFPFALESSYHVVNDQLVWEWKEPGINKKYFAARELDGKPLNAVLQEIESLK